jgi:hypothetical protein
MDQRLLAAPHGFSQRATSFIASWCQGIHRTPFSCSQPREQEAEAPHSHLAQEPSNPPRGEIDPSLSPMPPSPYRCENNDTKPDGRAIKHIQSRYASERIPAAGTWCSHTSSGQTCSRHVQTRQTLIHMSKEQTKPSRRKTRQHPHDHRTATPTGAPLNARTICFPTATITPLGDELLWRWTVSNRRPPACKAGALPLSYTPRR